MTVPPDREEQLARFRATEPGTWGSGYGLVFWAADTGRAWGPGPVPVGAPGLVVQWRDAPSWMSANSVKVGK